MLWHRRESGRHRHSNKQQGLPTVEMPYFQHRGHRFGPWSGNEYPTGCVAPKPSPSNQTNEKKKKKHLGEKSIIIPVFQMRQGSGKSLPRSHRVGLSAGNLIPELSSVPGHYTVKPTHKHKIRRNVFSLLPSRRSVAVEG